MSALETGEQHPVARLGHDLVRHLGHLPREEAATEIATHIKKFWDPRMRHQLLGLIRRGDMNLEPLLVQAAEHLVDGEIDRAEIKEPSGG